MKKKIVSLSMGLFLLFGTSVVNGQGLSVNTTGAAANSSAIFDASSTSQGMLIPRMTNAQRAAIAGPATGLLVYQTDGTSGFYFYDGSVWTSLNSAGGTAGGDLTGSYPNPTISSSASTGNNVITSINASGGGLSGTKLAINSTSVNAMSATGTRNSTTYLRGDNTWATVSGGSGTVTSVSAGVLTSGTTAFTDTVFHAIVVSPTTTPSIFFSFNNAAPATVLTNSVTGTPALPVYGKVVPQALYATSGTATTGNFYQGDGTWAAPTATVANPNVTSTTTTPYTVLSTDNYIVYNGSATSFTATMPTTGSATTGRIYYIKFNTTGAPAHLYISPQPGDKVMLPSNGGGGAYGYGIAGTSVDFWGPSFGFSAVALIADATNHQWNYLYTSY